MAFCANCGTQADGRFCPKCGSPMPADAGGGTAPGATPGATPGYAPPPAAPAQSSGMASNMAAALCYLLFCIIGGILMLVLEPYNKDKFVRFHAFQAIFFWVAWFALYIVCMVLAAVLVFIPVLGHLLLVLMYPIVGFAGFLIWLLLMYKAYNNEKFKLPIIGDLAEKQAR